MTAALCSPCPARVRPALVRTAVLCLVAAVLAVLLPTTSYAVPTFGERTVDVAARYKGVRYVYGGTSPRRGFDCSGYTRYVLARLGRTLPRTSQAQYDHARKVGKSVRAGDLVFFYSGSPRRGVYHVGIYAGARRIWHSPRPGRRVSVEPIWTGNWVGGRY